MASWNAGLDLNMSAVRHRPSFRINTMMIQKYSFGLYR